MSNLVISRSNPPHLSQNHEWSQYSASSYSPALEQSGIGEFINVLHRYKRLICGIIAAVTLSALLWQLTRPTLYSSTASVQVELIDAAGVNQADVMAKNSQRIANEIKLHSSRAAADRVVRDLDLYNRADFKNDVGDTLDGGKKQMVLRATDALLKMVDITSSEGSDLVEITVKSRSPDLAALIANQYPLSVQNLRTKKISERTDELIAALAKKQTELAAKAEESARAVSNFRISYAMLPGTATIEDLQQINRIAVEAISASGQSAAASARSAGVVRASQISSTAGASSAATQTLERQEAELASQLASKSQTYGSAHPEIVSLEAALSQVRGDLGSARAKASSDAAALANAEGARMAQMARSDAAGAASRAGLLRSQLGGMTQKAYQNIRDTVSLDVLTREADQAANAYNQITQRLSEIRAKNPLEGVNSTVVSPATVNKRAVSPEPMKTTTLAFLGSSIIAFLIAFAIDLFDNKLRTSAQIRKLFGLPTFGMLPLIDDNFGDKIEDSPVLQKPQSLFAEVSRAAYFDVNALAPSDQSQTVLVTSPLPGDGKSVVSVTLAAAAMASGRRVAVLDLDLRKTGLIQRLKRADTPDLIDILRGHVDFDKIALPMLPSPEEDQEESIGTETESDSTRIALISATRPVAEPAVLLGSKALQILLTDLRAKFDFIVINAPAALAVKDARTMCSFADHTLVVARWGRTTIGQMSATMELLGSNRVAGVIYDQVDYEKHAQGRYGDAIQYYSESASYYSDPIPSRTSFVDRIRRLFGRGEYAASTY